jgi:hypothetical protein
VANDSSGPCVLAGVTFSVRATEVVLRLSSEAAPPGDAPVPRLVGGVAPSVAMSATVGRRLAVCQNRHLVVLDARLPAESLATQRAVSGVMVTS